MAITIPVNLLTTTIHPSYNYTPDHALHACDYSYISPSYSELTSPQKASTMLCGNLKSSLEQANRQHTSSNLPNMEERGRKKSERMNEEGHRMRRRKIRETWNTNLGAVSTSRTPLSRMVRKM